MEVSRRATFLEKSETRQGHASELCGAAMCGGASSNGRVRPEAVSAELHLVEVSDEAGVSRPTK